MDLTNTTHRPTPKGTKKEFGDFGKYNTVRQYGKKCNIDKDEKYKLALYASFIDRKDLITELLSQLLKEVYIDDKDVRRSGLLKKKVKSIELIMKQIERLYKPKESNKK